MIAGWGRPASGQCDSSGAVGDRRGEPSSVRGRVLACFRDEWDVRLDDGRAVKCSIRARHFAEPGQDEKVLVAGDLVEVSVLPNGACVVEGRLPRTTTLCRLLPGSRRPKGQVIVANAEQVVVVASLGAPRLNRRLVDRFLVISESAGLDSVVVLNKIDLVSEDEWLPVARAYERAGYTVVPTSALDGRGVGRLDSLIRGHFSVLAGASGVGKSSLLNAIDPGLGLRVRAVSAKSGKGRHTTTNVVVVPLKDGTLVADTPGFRELGLWRVRADELGGLFPEFREYVSLCRFRGCRHGPEPGCAVKEAVEAGEIDRDRYDSYLRLLDELLGSEEAVR